MSKKNFMSKYNISPQFECQNRNSNGKLRNLASVRMSNTSLNVELQYLASVRMGFRMLKCDIRPQDACQNRILNVKI